MKFFEQLKKDLPAGIGAAKKYIKAKAVNVWDSGAALHKQEQAAQFENVNIRLLEKKYWESKCRKS
jgi:hypothetical protein